MTIGQKSGLIVQQYLGRIHTAPTLKDFTNDKPKTKLSWFQTTYKLELNIVVLDSFGSAFLF